MYYNVRIITSDTSCKILSVFSFLIIQCLLTPIFDVDHHPPSLFFFYQEVPPILLITNLKIFPSRKTVLEEYLVWRFWNYLFQNKGDSKLFSSGGFWPFDCKKVDLEFWLFFYTIGFFFVFYVRNWNTQVYWHKSVLM